jgi:hypothetical protein
VTTSFSAAELPTKIQTLLDERADHEAAIGQIDNTLAGVAAALGTAVPVAAAKTGPVAAATPVAKKPVPVKSKPAKRGAYAVSATDLVLAFVKSKGSPTSKEIGEHLASEGRSAGATSNALSVLTAAKKLTRKPLGKGKMGSTYSLA